MGIRVDGYPVLGNQFYLTLREAVVLCLGLCSTA